MTPFDRVFCIISEKIRFLIFTSFISDISLFSMNELIHHDLTVPRQVAYSNISFTVVFLVFCLATYDVLEMVSIIHQYQKPKKNRVGELPASVNFHRGDLEVSYGSITLEKDAFLIENNKNLSQNMKNSDESSHNWGIQISEKEVNTERNQKRSIPQINHNSPAQEYVPSSDPIKPKDFEKKYQSYIEFSNTGILEKKIHLKIAKYYNIGGLLRLLLF